MLPLFSRILHKSVLPEVVSTRDFFGEFKKSSSLLFCRRKSLHPHHFSEKGLHHPFPVLWYAHVVVFMSGPTSSQHTKDITPVILTDLFSLKSSLYNFLVELEGSKSFLVCESFGVFTTVTSWWKSVGKTDVSWKKLNWWISVNVLGCSNKGRVTHKGYVEG